MIRDQKAITALAFAFSLGLPTAVFSEEVRPINVPRQQLNDAIAELGAETGIQIIAPQELVSGLESTAVSGSMAPTDALKAMLAGTGLEVRLVGENSVVIARGAAEGEATEVETLMLDPVLVTGERVERSVFDTSSSVFVTTAEDLERDKTLRTTGDVLDFVPNVTTLGNPGEGPSIRGINTDGPVAGGGAFTGGAVPRATTSIDGRPVSFFEVVNGTSSIFDIERVEVFNGPQTTAQGVNAIAGATYVVTADPTFEPEFLAQTEIGNYERRRISAVASGPIFADQLAGRIAIDFQSRESAIDGLAPLQGVDTDEFRSITTRAKLLWEPASIPELSTKLTLQYTDNRQPQAEFVADPIENLVALPGVSAVFANETLTATNDISYEFSNGLVLTNQFLFADVEIDRFSQPGSGNLRIEREEYRNESTLRFDALDGRLSGLLGTSIFLTDADENVDFSAFLGFGNFTDRRISLGIFGELTYAVTDRLDVTAGLRYQRDSQDRSGPIGPFFLDFDESFDAFLPKFAVGYDLTDDLRIGASVSRGFNPGGFTLDFFSANFDTFDEETVWNYELFARGSFFGGRMNAQVNAFFADYRDFQRSVIVGFGPTGLPISEIENADRAISYGLELEVDALVLDELRIFTSLGLLQTEIRKFDAAAAPGVVGSEFPRAPNVTFAFGADYEVIDNLTLGTRVRFTDSYFNGADEDPASRNDAYVVADFSLSYTFRNVEAFAYVDNAFNNIYTTNGGVAGFNIIGQPREFGIGFRVDL